MKVFDALVNLPLFVYGTLKQGFSNHNAFLKEAEFVGEGTIKGTLLDLKYYPGFVADGEGLVHGELYNITKSQLVSIDQLEGVGFHYDRIIVEVFTKKGRSKAWTYEYSIDNNYDISRIIPNGIWNKERYVPGKSSSVQVE